MEAMAAESLLASAWIMDGYLTKTRWPLAVDNGYTDVDVIGVRGGCVRMGECKVRSGARRVYVVRGDDAARFTQDWLGAWAGTLENVARLWRAAPPWLPAPGGCEALEFWFCANLWFPDEGLRESAERDLTASLRALCPHGLKGKATARVVSTLDVLLHVVASIRKRVVDEEHGKRFGDPVLDALRELVRYAHPLPADGGRIGGEIRACTIARLHDALGIASADGDAETVSARGLAEALP